MIGRIHERREFERVNRDGRRARCETLWCRYLDDPTAMPPRVAFAIGRPVGSAVIRNRLRRRLRALLTAMAPTLLPHGSLLLGARPPAVELTFEELRVELMSLLSTIRHQAVRA